MQNRFLRTLLLLTSISLSAVGCESPTDLPVDSARPSFGTLANSDLSTYYYPHREGLTYVYSNKITTTTANGSTTATGNNDTVRTLGFKGFVGNDSVFAVSITYQVAQRYAGRSVMSL